MTRRAVALLALPLLLGACSATGPARIYGYGPPIVSAQYPPGTGAVNAHALIQTANSLPPGAANIGRAPGAVMPDFGAIAIGGY